MKILATTLTNLSTAQNGSFFSAIISLRDLCQRGFVMDLETLMASSCRRRILRVLSRKRTNVMELVRKVNSTYNQVNSNLQILQKEGIIFDEHFGRMRVIRLNRENPRTASLLQALKILESPKDKRNNKNKPQLEKPIRTLQKPVERKVTKTSKKNVCQLPKSCWNMIAYLLCFCLYVEHFNKTVYQ